MFDWTSRESYLKQPEPAGLLQQQALLPFDKGGALCICTEGVTGTMLGVYHMRTWLIGDPARDDMLACLLTSSLIHPLMAVVFARLVAQRPLLLAIVASVSLGLLEVWFVRAGYMRYEAWHPAASTAFYLAGALALVIAEALLHATGGVMFWKWSLWLSAARYTFGMGVVSLYDWWLHQEERSLTLAR